MFYFEQSIYYNLTAIVIFFVIKQLANYGRRHLKLLTNCHVDHVDCRFCAEALLTVTRSTRRQRKCAKPLLSITKKFLDDIACPHVLLYVRSTVVKDVDEECLICFFFIERNDLNVFRHK